MTFEVFTPDEMRAHYKQARDKTEALRILADCSNASVKQVAKLLGIPTSGIRYRKRVDEQRLHELFKAGVPAKEIAKEFGVTPNTVYTWKSKMEE